MTAWCLKCRGDIKYRENVTPYCEKCNSTQIGVSNRPWQITSGDFFFLKALHISPEVPFPQRWFRDRS